MGLFVIVVAAITAILSSALIPAFLANKELNGIIAAVLVLGVLFAFRQVWALNAEVAWIESFRHDRSALSGEAPRLLSPLANMLGDRRGGRLSLSPMALRSVLDGIGARLDESRETARYLIGVLVFLGLLGTFYGLLETVRSVGGVIATLNAGADAARAMSDLKAGLQTPLSGMATAFSSSLFGLAGSLVLGFLDLQAGQAQNRFYNELEEWLSGLTRISGPGTEGDASVPAYIQALLEQTADSLDNLQRIMAKSEEGRAQANQAYLQLIERIALMTDQMRTEQSVMVKVAEMQQELRPILARLAEFGRAGGLGLDDATRAAIRSLDQSVRGMAEASAAGREQTVQEIRTEIRLLARTIAALADGAERR
jgi:hypothetical protein